MSDTPEVEPEKNTAELEQLAEPAPVVAVIDEEHEHTDAELIAGFAPVPAETVPPAPPGFTRMTNAALNATADVPDPAIPFHLANGWVADPPPSGDNPTTPED